MSGHVDIRDVSVRFGRNGQQTDAVSGVSLEVKPGDFVTVIGPSGCGKSTLLNIVAGLLDASTGEVFVEDDVVRTPGPDRAVAEPQTRAAYAGEDAPTRKVFARRHG